MLSLFAHAAALVWFDALLRGGGARSARSPDESAALISPPRPDAAGQEALAGVTLVDERMLGPLLAASVGPADQAGFDQEHPLPSADMDLPGTRPAGRGGGDDRGGVPSFTGRRDRDQLRSQIWNGLERYQVPHQQSGETSSTPEELARLPRPGFDARKSQARRARSGAERAQTGNAGADGTGGRTDEVDRAWRDADPRLDTGPAAMQVERQTGSTEAGQERPLVDRGASAIETERLGPARDADSAAAASSERDPMPLELTSPSAGGVDTGVRGARARGGASPSSPLGGSGTAATRADLAVGSGRPALRAQRQDPYFRRMYERIDSVIRFPRELALALEQGEVVVTFTLSASGSVSDVRVLKSSGFLEFDDELTRALRVAAPFGPVPAALRGRADRVGVTAPYKFRNPLIR
jgi:TonB family protein